MPWRRVSWTCCSPHSKRRPGCGWVVALLRSNVSGLMKFVRLIVCACLMKSF